MSQYRDGSSAARTAAARAVGCQSSQMIATRTQSLMAAGVLPASLYMASAGQTSYPIRPVEIDQWAAGSYVIPYTSSGDGPFGGWAGHTSYVTRSAEIEQWATMGIRHTSYAQRTYMCRRGGSCHTPSGDRPAHSYGPRIRSTFRFLGPAMTIEGYGMIG